MCFYQWKTFCVSKAKRTILKKINVSFIVHFSLGKYSISPDIFWYSLCLEENWCLLIVHFYLGK